MTYISLNAVNVPRSSVTLYSGISSFKKIKQPDTRFFKNGR